MTVKFICDGCGLPTDDHTERGLVNPAHYCPQCLPDVDEFIASRDALHTEISTSFRERLDLLKAKFMETHPGGRLP